MTMVIVALALSLLFIVGGGIITEHTSGYDGIIPYFLGVLPGIAGLVIAIVALGIHLIPATTTWSWLPAILSCGATISMVVYAAGAAILSKLFR